MGQGFSPEHTFKSMIWDELDNFPAPNNSYWVYQIISKYIDKKCQKIS